MEEKIEVESSETAESVETSASPIFDITEDDNSSKLVIKFDELFSKEKFSIFNTFDLSAKRNFKMIANLIKETYENIFLNENGTVKDNLSICLLQILYAQSQIMRTDNISADDFLKLIDKILIVGDNALLTAIDSFIENGYKLELDKDTKKMKEKKKTVNDQLIISDSYAKILIKIAYLDRIIMPLISQYFIYNKQYFPVKVSAVQENDGEEDKEDQVFNEINQTFFNYLFKVVAKENTENLQNKIYKMVIARIMRTSFSAKKFWTVAESVGISKESSALEIFSKLISNSVPKIILNKDLNVVNYLSTIINNQILFLFSNKFKTHYQSINSSTDSGSMFEANDDSMTELEKMEMHLSRKNEGSLIVKNIIAQDVICTLDEFLNVSTTKEEIAETLKYVHMNPIQEKIVSLLTFKYFKSADAIKHLTAYEYAKLLICCKKYLEKNKFILLPKILMSNCVKQRDRTAITGIKIKSKIEDSKRYKELLDTKYHDFKFDIERNIQAIISTIYNSSFIDERGNDVFESSANIGNVAEEIIDICYLV